MEIGLRSSDGINSPMAHMLVFGQGEVRQRNASCTL
ncbi:hypothetical protein SAMN05192548_1001352 [Paraburkholderia terricola]|uniref:Uncharacterized protein n=1 Tax=Paraburkholderia terricola TaxID=169427 RepID=A0A1M6J347_9BURK|nr:hypothetical protein SAMN05192547_10013 [Paraburkholderia sediminicola]SHJ40961.1 hypothetical protein SAMN05192548_1001352 [Paraburkholderia terricola]